VKGFSIGWLSITQCEINRNCQVHIAATKDIFQKAMSFLELKLGE